MTLAKPVIRHPKTELSDYEKYLQQNPMAEEYIGWQKLQIQNDLNQPAEIDFCLSQTKMRTKLSNDCTESIDSVLQKPLNQNSLELLEYLFDKIQNQDTDLGKFKKLFIGMNGSVKTRTVKSEKLNSVQRKLNQKYGFENSEILINGKGISEIGPINPQAEYQFVILSDTSSAIVKVETFLEFEKRLTEINQPKTLNLRLQNLKCCFQIFV